MSDDTLHPLLGEGGPSAAGWHQIEGYLKCPKRFQFEKVRGVTIPRQGTPAYFAVGSMFHAGRAVLFTTPTWDWAELEPSIKAAIAKVEAEYAATGLPVHPSAAIDALRYLREYAMHYAMQPRPRTVGAEYPLGPADIGGVERTARLDDVSYYQEAGGRLCIGESKTTGADIPTTVEQYIQHGQPMLQALLWKTAHNGEAQYGDIAGVMLDVVKKGYNGAPCTFARRFIEINDYQLRWYAASLAKSVADAATVAWDSVVERRITSCTEMVGTRRVACPYRDLCRFGRDAALTYVTKDGSRLIDYQPTEDATSMPWE